MDTRMFVITHKKTKTPNIDKYSSMLVGASIHEEVDDQFDVKDNSGENISEKNPNYCELTGIYWIWKNAKVDNVGICHYRRFFSHKFIFGNKKYFLQGKDIERLLEKYSIIVPKPRCYEKTTLLSINYAPNMDDVKELYRAVKTCSPDYLDDFIGYFNQNKSYLYNMCSNTTKNSSPTVSICQVILLSIINFRLSRGCSFITVSVGGREASAIAAKVSIIRLTHNIWVTVKGTSVPIKAPTRTIRQAATLTVIWNRMKRWMFL